MSDYKITFTSTLDEELLKKWQDLWEETEKANLHNSPKWIRCCIEGLDIRHCHFLTVEKDEQLDAIFPLVLQKRFGISAWCSPGEAYTDKTSLLLRDEDPKLIKAVVNKLTELGNLYLEEFSSDLADALLKSDKRLRKQKASINYYLPLVPDALSRTSNKVKNRLLNRIKKLGDQLTYQRYVGDLKALDIVFEVDTRSTKSKQGKGSFVTQKEQKFLQTLCRVLGRSFEVNILSFEKVPTLYAVGFTYRKVFHAFLTAYDGSYAFLSPGKLIHFYLFDSLKADGIELFDFSRGVTYLKKEFTDLFNVQYDVLYSKSSLIMSWWKFCDWLYYFVLNNKLLYGIYLFFKNKLRH